MLENVEKSEIKKLFQNHEKRAIIIRDDMRENEIVISGFMHVIRLPKNSSANKLNSTRK